MCGDVDDDPRESDFYWRFLAHSQSLLAAQPTSSGDLNGYLDQLFADVLLRCCKDLDAVQPPDAYRRMAMQSLVLGRLAGFLAGHVALDEDPLRKLMEAQLLGYAEAESRPHLHGHDHAHEGGHSHAHGH